ncbi:MAG: FAD-binding oxidoreductase [Gammaproteobacteria bacterium]|nr:FAD-binding oxidoreductase [Gammaproteobacteria bacterium]
MHSVDFLINGQGLAGSLIAFELLQRKKTVLVIDNSHHAAASQVAAGLINPVTGHRLNITNNFYEYQKAASPFYRSVEKTLGVKLYQSLKQTRLIKNQGQFDYLQKRLQEDKYGPILKNHMDKGNWFNDQEQYPYGAINVSQTATVNAPLLLKTTKDWLVGQNSLTTEKFNYDHLKAGESSVNYREIRASSVVFCEGFQAMYNPWLDHLPFKTAKGEILTIQTKSCELDRMLSWGHWLVPQEDGTAKLGANYLWNDLSLTTNVDTVQQFLSSLEQYIGIEATVIKHAAGIRPSTTQRKPFVGRLSKLPNAFCFNGLGAKGCLLAPHFTTLLADHMLYDRPISEEFTQWL